MNFTVIGGGGRRRRRPDRYRSIGGLTADGGAGRCRGRRLRLEPERIAFRLTGRRPLLLQRLEVHVERRRIDRLLGRPPFVAGAAPTGGLDVGGSGRPTRQLHQQKRRNDDPQQNEQERRGPGSTARRMAQFPLPASR